MVLFKKEHFIRQRWEKRGTYLFRYMFTHTHIHKYSHILMHSTRIVIQILILCHTTKENYSSNKERGRRERRRRRRGEEEGEKLGKYVGRKGETLLLFCSVGALPAVHMASQTEQVPWGQEEPEEEEYQTFFECLSCARYSKCFPCIDLLLITTLCGKHWWFSPSINKETATESLS